MKLRDVIDNYYDIYRSDVKVITFIPNTFSYVNGMWPFAHELRLYCDDSSESMEDSTNLGSIKLSLDITLDEYINILKMQRDPDGNFISKTIVSGYTLQPAYDKLEYISAKIRLNNNLKNDLKDKDEVKEKKVKI